MESRWVVSRACCTCFACHALTDTRSGQECAVKILNKRRLAMYSADLVPQLLREITLLHQIRHPNIIQLFDVFQDDEHIFVVMELMTGGELFDFVITRGALRETDARDILKQVLKAIVYLHQRGIIHRDLKPGSMPCHLALLRALTDTGTGCQKTYCCETARNPYV